MKIPHGTVPFAGIKDNATREAVMRLNENIAALKRALEAALDKIEKLEKEAKQNG